MQDFWSKAMDAVAEQVSVQVFEAWIRPLKAGGEVGDGQFQVYAANDFSADWVKKRYGGLLEEILSEQLGEPVTLLFAADPALEKPVASKTQTVTPVQSGGETGDQENFHSGLDPRYTFDSFVVGGCNQFVHAAAARVAEAPAAAYNPLFIHGGVGLGKTHVMQAIGNRVLEIDPDKRVLYISSENFMTQLINSLRFKRVFDFKENFRSVDVLLVDDIQFIAGKKATQEEFFHTFNALYEAKKQIVMTADSFPHEIEHLEERLRSRFGMGLVADMQPPDLETRVAILQKKAGSEGLRLADEVAFFLADAVQTNVRELEGALIRVSAYASLTGKPITMALVKESLKDIVRGQDRAVTVEQIQKTVANYYKVKVTDLCSNSRSRIYSHPRQIAMYLCKQLTQHSYPEIGHRFGGRDHTTVLYAVSQVDKKQGSTPALADELASLKSMLQK
ncbi:chromosomal replication initiator protein DnaA [Magnetococcus marinus MC-1]|uniref:Chromosomal replication initiator protein DnaA n=1 Tax=Magnetococcus marinus (strain ATCC BAA-1437 / JCM 17883 / MC-1) TaxID=156889 RepID=DNAA_MAGMM|nr:chromosomal replication initiator protein DnaA [Magnetococcus marinus]A0L3I7.1 RecName: Full=Chromosomal replication initiator protein DnaA [Magnetococcus marinus MC-1]ABK42530.1 chromosomal replication initiator protein DnaA [Magnetococcus marinus MC-1]